MEMFEPLRKAGYEERKSQIEMAEKIKELMERGGVWMLEAPTGTGKTFAYLIPAILSGKKVLVSTYSKLLQEQLLRDVKELGRIYGKDIRVGAWKGVSSYICRVKLGEDYDPEIDMRAQEVEGDVLRMELDRETVKKYTVEDHQECEGCTRKDCYYRMARARALSADVAVVNHHVLATFPDVMRECGLVVIDEGHEFPEVLIEAQAIEFSEKTIKELLGRESTEETELPEVIEELELLLMSMKKRAKVEIGYLLSRGGSITTATYNGIKKYAGFLPDLEEYEDVYIEEGYSELDKKIWKILGRIRKAVNLKSKIEDYVKGKVGFEKFVEEGSKWRKFRMVPLFGNLKGFLKDEHPPIAFVSATLDRDYMKMMLSLEEGDYEHFSFPPEWDYGFEIKVLDVHPKEEVWKEALVYAVEEAKKEFDKVIVLLTNREHLDLIDTPLKQGGAGLRVLLERFAERGGVLAGVDTFWKGVDVPGRKALVIGKLPFKNPEDPLHARRSEFLRDYYGTKAMWKYIKGVAKMDLKQGIGRLKRRKEDAGTIYLVDNRVFKGFFRDFLDVLSSYGNVNLLTHYTNPAIP